MKSFKNILSEVSQPKSPEEKAFKDQHKIELIKHPVAPDSQFTGEIEGKSKKKRVADNDAGSDEKAYDQAYLEKGKTFKMPRNIDEAAAATVERARTPVGQRPKGLGWVLKLSGRQAGTKHDVWERRVKKVAEEVQEIEEKAVSQAQQKLMAMALSLKRGEMKASDASDAVKDLAKGMSMKDLEDFAKTKHKGLPAKVEKESKKLSFKEMVQKVEGKEEIQEDAYEEIPMMKSQLNYIIYAAEEIMDYLDMVDDPEEWYQNKLSGVFYEMQSLHAYVEGEKRMMDMEPEDEDDMEDSYYGEETEPTEEEVEQVDEGKGYSPGWMLRHPDGAKLSAALKAKKELERKRRQAYGNPSAGISVKKEEVELDESIKAGMMKLKNGDTVKVSDKDAKLLSDMLKDLNDKNRKEMEKVMMMDKKGFEEILGFAKEAMQ